MSAWNVNLYMQFGIERTQPAIDLITKINIKNPKRIIDLGCGPGNSTEILRDRWPGAKVTGLDSSPEMITSSRKNYPTEEWILADVETWKPSSVYDIIFSNAALQWIPSHNLLLPRLFAQVTPEGALAFQIPAHVNSPLQQIILEVADDPEWVQLMKGAKKALTIESPSYYYDNLVGIASKLDIWETEYYHVMNNTQAIVSWITSTGLRPFLEALESESQRYHFLHLFSDRIAHAYKSQQNGKVLFPFRRFFVVAYS